MDEKKLTDDRFLKDGFYQPKSKDEEKEIRSMGKDLTFENLYRHCADMEKQNAELKKQVEELTEENSIIKGNPPIIAGRSLGKTIREKLLVFDRMKEQNAELQKQVEELEVELQRQFNKGVKCGYDLRKFKKYTITRKAVKNTAKEILTSALEGFVFNFTADSEDYRNGYDKAIGDYDDKLKEFIKEHYGVEVE